MVLVMAVLMLVMSAAPALAAAGGTDRPRNSHLAYENMPCGTCVKHPMLATVVALINARRD